jgi:hypothetical protein
MKGKGCWASQASALKIAFACGPIEACQQDRRRDYDQTLLDEVAADAGAGLFAARHIAN